MHIVHGRSKSFSVNSFHTVNKTDALKQDCFNVFASDKKKATKVHQVICKKLRFRKKRCYDFLFKERRYCVSSLDMRHILIVNGYLKEI